MQVFQYRKQDHKQEQLHNRKRWFQFRNLDRKRFQRRNLGRMLEWCHSSLYRSRHPSS